MNTQNRCRSGSLILAAFLLPGTLALGQSDENSEDVFELSPFTVEAETDGYRATNTLAGTRLRSSMKDIASPISIFTKELMEDVGADDLQEALMYSVNTENEEEYAPDDTEGLSVGSTTQTRVRGISTPAAQSREFFRTEFRGDGYNTQSFTVARGPNSVLFGLGSPAGVMEQSLKRATLNKTFGEVKLKFDNFSGHRETVDYNVPLIENKLGVRVAVMNQDRRTYRDPDYNKETRFFITSTFQASENTSIRASWEDMDNDIVRGRSTLTNDYLGAYQRAGNPIYNNSPGDDFGLWSWDNGSTWRAPDANKSNEAWLIDDAKGTTSNRMFMAGGHLGGDAVQGLRWVGSSTSILDDGSETVSFIDGSVLPTDYNVRGVASSTDFSGEAFGLTLEHKFADNFYIEAAYNKESTHRYSFDPLRSSAGLERDVNAFLPGTSTANPNLGRYFVESQFLGWDIRKNYETKRLTSSYELDLTENNKWLGKHNFGFLYQEDEFDVLQIKTRLMNQGNEVDIREGNDYASEVGQGRNNVQMRYYLDVPGLGGDADGLAYPGSFVLPPWNSIVAGIQGDGRPSHTLQTVEGKMFVTQSEFLNNNLILTFGYRDDTETTQKAAINDRDSVTGAFIFEGVPFDEEGIVESGITRTHGLVYHTPVKGLSVFANKSDTFKPQGLLTDWFGDPFGSSTGEGEDYGISFELMDGKVGGRLGKFEASAANNSETDWFFEITKWRIVNTMENWIEDYNENIYPLLGVDSIGDVFVERPPVGDSIRVDRSFTTKGYELELYAKPAEGLDVRVTVAKSETVNSDINSKMLDYIEARSPVWEKYYGLPQPWYVKRDISNQRAENSDNPDFVPDANRYTLTDSMGNSVNASTPTSDYLNTPRTIGEGMFLNAFRFPRIEAQKAVNGLKTDRSREWRANVIATYRFSEGKFKGSALGGAYRWRSKSAIGYGGKENPLGSNYPLVDDLSKPYFGEAISDFDFWYSFSRPIKIGEKDIDWKIQLNVQNAFTGGSDLYVQSLDLDGTPLKYAQNAPRTFSLTNTFKF